MPSGIASQHFDVNARQYFGQETAITYGVGPQSRIFSPVGLLARSYLRVTGNIPLTLTGGGTAAYKALGLWAFIQRVRLTTNNNISIVDVSGFGLFLINLLQDHKFDPSADWDTPTQVGDLNTQARTNWYSQPVLANGNNNYAFTLMLPVQINDYDPIGLIMLQNRRTVVTLEITFDNPVTNNTITLTPGGGTATLGTTTSTVEITNEIFNIPEDEATWPDLSIVHKLTEDQIALANTGDNTYNMPIGNTYMRMWQVVTCNGVRSDALDEGRLKINTADTPYVLSAGLWQWLTFRRLGFPAPVGCYLWDFYYQGTPNLNGIRDLIDSKDVAQLQAIIKITGGTTIAAGDTIRNIREELVNIEG